MRLRFATDGIRESRIAESSIVAVSAWDILGVSPCTKSVGMVPAAQENLQRKDRAKRIGCTEG